MSNYNYMPGMPCPVCNSFIPMSIKQLLHSGTLVCPQCGMKLNIDNKISDKAIEALNKLKKQEEAHE